ncbi:hypothetical protein ACFLRT_05755, partial [Acidobacteriota bacterium]
IKVIIPVILVLMVFSCAFLQETGSDWRRMKTFATESTAITEPILSHEGAQVNTFHCEEPPKVFLESISFNHDKNDNSGADAINIRKNFNEPVHIPEWERGEKPFPAAYIINNNITIVARFSINKSVKFDTKIWAETIIGELGYVEEKIVKFRDGKSGPIPFNVFGTTPGKITSFFQQWRWYFKDLNDDDSLPMEIGDSKNKLYVILAEPQSPWKTSGQTEPWTDALDWSCKWANCETTPEGAAGKITKALFKTIGGLYDTLEGRARYTDLDRTDGEGAPFALTNFIDYFPKVGVVNCNDMGKSLVTFSNVVGCGMSYQKVYYSGIYLNCINAIGRGWTNNPFYELSGHPPILGRDWGYSSGRTSFSYHTFGSISCNVFDASLTVDTDSSPDCPPYTETWMINQPWDRYKKRLIDRYPNPVKIAFDIY